jgi:Fur family peroxide stress response transcriptional regulator
MIQRQNPNELATKLKQYGFRLTHQRIAIYNELCQSKEHPTAEAIYDSLKVVYPELSLATVYKTLDSFSRKGLIRKIKGSDNSTHFDADLSIHTHLICNKTNSILDYENNELSVMLENFFKERSISNFRISDFQFSIIGEIEKTEST